RLEEPPSPALADVPALPPEPSSLFSDRLHEEWKALADLRDRVIALRAEADTAAGLDSPRAFADLESIRAGSRLLATCALRLAQLDPPPFELALVPALPASDAVVAPRRSVIVDVEP